MTRRFQFSLGRLMRSMAFACCSAWLLRNHDSLATFFFPFVAGSAVGRLFGRPLAGVVAVAGLLYAAFLFLLTIAGISEGRTFLLPALVGFGLIITFLATLATIRRWNGRRECLES